MSPILQTPPQSLCRFVKTGPAFAVDQQTLDTFTGLTFRLSDVPENGAYLILWSFYQIEKVELQFRPMYRANRVADAAAIGLIPEIYVAFDPDSTRATPVNLDEMRRYADLTVTDDSDGFVVSFRPRFAKTVFESALLSTYEPSNDQDWLPTIHNTVPHYNLFVAVTGSNVIGPGPFQAWNVVARYTLKFKDQR